MGKPPSLPERHTRLYMSGFSVCGGLRMMGASGGAAAFEAFSVAAAPKRNFVGGELANAISAPKSPPLSSLWAISTGAISSAFVPASKGAVKGGVWLHLRDDVRLPRAEGTLNHVRASFPNKPCCKKPAPEMPAQTRARCRAAPLRDACFFWAGQWFLGWFFGCLGLGLVFFTVAKTENLKGNVCRHGLPSISNKLSSGNAR